MRAKALGVAVVAMVCLTGVSATLKEASATLEAANISPFMTRVAKLIDSGFGDGESNEIVRLITSMKADDEIVREFTVKCDGRETPLGIHIIIGARESVGLAFLTSPELADRIQRERNAFLDELDKGHP